MTLLPGRYVQSSKILSRRTSRRVLLLLPGLDRELLRLGGTGPWVWDVFEDAHSLTEAANALGSIFGSDGRTVRADIEGTVQRLVDAGALVECPEA